MTQNFTHLHVHTDSSHDGLGTLESLVETARDKGFKHLAVTEHGNLASSIAFTQACHREGIKPILGNEAYIDIGDGKNHHITLLADGNKGFDNLIELNNLGVMGGLKRGAITLEQLLKHSENVIVLSGCPVSPMQNVEEADARKIALELKKVFGDRFFIEIMFTNDGTLPSWERSLQLSKDLNVPLITSNDVHFAKKEYASVHALYQEMKSFGRFGYNSEYLWLTTYDEMVERVNGIGRAITPKLIEGMENSYKLAEKLGVVKFDSTPKLPHIHNAPNTLRNAVMTALRRFKEENKGKYDEAELDARIKKELDVIIGKDYSTYFLITKDLIDTARASDVMVGPGRGSAVGSFVSYLLGITEINPLDFGLIFERFLNPNRSAMPDIDTDIPASKRGVVLDYAKNTYNAFPIATQSRMTEKMCLRDICRALRTNREEENAVAEAGYGSDVYKRLCAKYEGFGEAYEVMVNQIRHYGKHAGGIIIAENVKVPLVRASDGETLMASWTEGANAELSKAGVVKFDMLGLSALDILTELYKLTGVKPPTPSFNAPEFSLVREGKVLGIFQLTGSDGIREYATRVQPNSIEDIIATVSLWRTGPIQANAHELFLDARHGKPRKIHKDVDEILKNTFGLIVYQEDFMRLYAWATGKNEGDADNARRIIVKFKPDKAESVLELKELETEFKVGCVVKGLTQTQADKLWSEIVTHTGYSFNKSHATAYAHISWQMIWYKYHYPAEFYTALLNNDPDKLQEYIFEVISDGFEISLPEINKSGKNYTTDGKIIYVPFSAIKFLGENAVDEIMMTRPFASAKDFMEKISKKKVTKRARAGLYALGAFKNISGGMEEYDISEVDMINIDKATPFTKQMKKYFKKNYGLVFSVLSGEATEAEILQLSKLFSEMSDGDVNTLVNELSNVVVGSNAMHIGMINHIIMREHETIVRNFHGQLKLDKDARQQKFLGIIIPTKERCEKINKAIENGKTAGIIVDIEQRSSSYNPVYYRLQIYPGRSCWTAVKSGLETGIWIEADLSGKSGKIKHWERI